MQEGMAPTQEEIEGTLASTISDPERLRTVSLLLCDIRGFSTMAEMIPSSDLAQILGEWFRKAGNMIQDSGGVIDKFIGDAILAYWTKHEAGPNECEAALKAGEQLLQIAETVKWPIPAPDFDVVVALHCGDVACSNIGLVALRDATVSGDAVHTVCRIEPLIKQLGRRLVASKDFLSGLRVTPPTIDLGEHSLKGKRRPVQLFAFQ
jgi:adenylate cyclase